MFKPSSYQLAVYDFIKNGKGNLSVSAVAGSGKTTTIVEAAHLIRGRSLFCAFNKEIAETLKQRLPTHVEASTIHSAGRRLIVEYTKIRNLSLRHDKYKRIMQGYFHANPNVWKSVARVMDDPEGECDYDEEDVMKELEKFFQLMRLTLTPTETFAMEDLAETYQLNAVFFFISCVRTSQFLTFVQSCLQQGHILAETGEIDFTDMIYMPNVWQHYGASYDWVFVDEAQDLSAAARKLVMGMGRKGRMVFVGDPYQAIMGFAGADFQSYQAIISEANCTVLPLSVCYRCPSNHVSLAATIVPHIEPSAFATVGVLQEIPQREIVDMADQGDMILCRLNAPLLSLCLSLLANGVPAKIRGRDVGQGLIALATKIEKRIAKALARGDGSFRDLFITALNAWLFNETKILEEKERHHMIEAAKDKANMLMILLDNAGVTSVSGMKNHLNNLFSDDVSPVILSTVHKAKGLEADRVFIVSPHKLPLVFKHSTDAQRIQEQNLRYVALTRAKKELYIAVGTESYGWSFFVKEHAYEEVLV